jgi:hypothetical protein
LRAALGSGIPNDNIRIGGADKEWPHVWDWLFSRHVPERDRSYYRTHLAEGRTALSVLLDGGASPAGIDAVEDILERFHPVDVREQEDEKGSTAATAAAGARAAPERAATEETVIPIPREELKVGTRATDRVQHIRTYVVESRSGGCGINRDGVRARRAIPTVPARVTQSAYRPVQLRPQSPRLCPSAVCGPSW